MSSRFSKDNRAGAEIFSLVPSAVVKHDSLRNLAEKLQFWQQDLPTPSPLLSELKEWQYFWKQYTPTLQLPGNLIGCVKYADEDMYPNIRVLLIIGCTLPVSSAEAGVHSLACDESSHISETGCLMSGCQNLHSCIYIMTLTLMLMKSVQSL